MNTQNNPKRMSAIQVRAVASISLILALRMLGLFMIVPIFALYASRMPAATPFLVGIAMGIYGLTQASLQIPFGMLSDRVGRRPIVVVGLGIFIVGSIIAALSTSIHGMILGRALQGGGAIGSTLMALIADSTREQDRSTAMAISGMTIGLSFMLAMVLGPLLSACLAWQQLFWISALLGLAAIAVLFALTPVPVSVAARHVYTQPHSNQSLWQHPELLQLNAGIFILHAILTAIFIIIPITLYRDLRIPGSEQWQLYIPVLFIACLFSLFLISLAERQQRIKSYVLAAIIALFVSILLLRYLPMRYGFFLLSSGLFFTAFSMLEAFLPSLVSRAAPATRKGAAMGLFSSAQFLGIFAGGSIGGLLYQQWGLNIIYPFCALLALLWLGIAYRMRSPRYLMTHVLQLASAQNAWPEIAEQLLAIPGIAEITFHPEEKTAILKLEHKALNHPDFQRLEQILQTSV